LISIRDLFKVVKDRFSLPLLNDSLFRRFFEVPSVERVLETSSLGSGVIIDAENGLILTNFHVIKDAYEINITLTDRKSVV
jgi:S1-C subfamily serine protease